MMATKTMRLLGTTTILIMGIALTACVGPNAVVQDQGTSASTNSLIVTDVEQCRIALQNEPTEGTMALDRTRMRLLNWNTQKNTKADIQADLTRLADGADLILLQEAVRNSAAFADINGGYHWSFSPGYKQDNISTGVMTASRVKPLAQCSLTNHEPWLRSPKATNITEFAIQGTDKTLLVLNLHLINFTVGLEDMSQQLMQALSFVDTHEGPVIVSGDFNTWRKARRDLVLGALEARGLEPVGYTDDVRKRVFGYALDHTFVRDIKVAQGTSHSVSSSDHNPTSVTMEF